MGMSSSVSTRSESWCVKAGWERKSLFRAGGDARLACFFLHVLSPRAPSQTTMAQAAFNEAMATNMDDFDMDRAAAVAAALDELKLQVCDWRDGSMRVGLCPPPLSLSLTLHTQPLRPTLTHRASKRRAS